MKSTNDCAIRSAELAELTATAKRIVAQIKVALEVAQHKHGVYHFHFHHDGRGLYSSQEKVTRH